MTAVGSARVIIGSAGATPTGAAGGDLSGTYPNPVVIQSTNATGFMAIAFSATMTPGGQNERFGMNALLNPTFVAGTSGYANNAFGDNALRLNTTGLENCGFGTNALFNNTTASENTALGTDTLTNLSAGIGNNTAVGATCLYAQTSGHDNTAIGFGAGLTANASNATTTGSACTIVGSQAGQAFATQNSNTSLLGYQALSGGNNAIAIGSSAFASTNGLAIGNSTSAGAAGAIAIGMDHTGASASTTTQDQIMLGTSAHQVMISNNTTGSGTALLGANCPAGTVTAPYTWLKLYSGDGSTVYVPVWK